MTQPKIPVGMHSTKMSIFLKGIETVNIVVIMVIMPFQIYFTLKLMRQVHWLKGKQTKDTMEFDL